LLLSSIYGENIAIVLRRLIGIQSVFRFKWHGPGRMLHAAVLWLCAAKKLCSVVSVCDRSRDEILY
jgi:hypothetical protein